MIENFYVVKELLLYSRFLFAKGRFQKKWILWRIETYYGIPADDFQFRKLPSISTLVGDLWGFGRWLYQIKKVR